ncbi:hypothetical protein NTJ12_002259 [Flavobacterium psychrophilum]|nr:hypothetical protein [Flavobacterium psychrophilum]
MENRRVYATLWEDDAAGAGHNKANEKNKMKTLPGTVKGGIADIDFVLEPDFAKIANAIKAKGDADEGKTHEYYVTAEILNKKTASANTNVANPSYKDTTTTKPATPKKETPAQKKGPSKKQEKEKEKSIGDDIIDWWEGLFKVKPIVAPNPEAPTGNNPLKTGEPGKNPKEDKKDNKKSTCPNCDKPVTAAELKQIFTQADDATLKKAADTYSKYMKELNMNTCWNKAHFFAQAIVESGLKLKVKDGENFNWYYESLPGTFKAFRTEEGKKKAELWGRSVRIPIHPGVTDQNQKNIANWAYSSNCDKGKELGNTQPNDGWDFRGKGLVQLTGRKAYNYANTYTKKESANILDNPDLVSTDIGIAVLSSMAFFKWKDINIITNGKSETKPISKRVGIEVDGSYTKKQNAFDDVTAKTFKISACKWSKTKADSKVIIKFGSNTNKAVVSEKSLQILRDVGEETKNFLINITSTARDPYNQARVMYDNIINKGMREQRITYLDPGQKVLDAYEAAKEKGKNKEGIIKDMETKIIEVGPGKVSKHCGDPKVKNVFDVSQVGLSNPKDFKNKITSKVNKVLDENGCYHIEINQ